MTPLFQGEVQLRRWSESSSQGVQVTFALADSDDLEPLKMKSGKRFMAVLVEIGDDEQAVQPPKEPIGPLCKWLVMRCAEPEFWAFLVHQFSAVNEAPTSADECTEVVKSLLRIKSRREVDDSLAKKVLFDDLIRNPYQRYLVRRSA